MKNNNLLWCLLVAIAVVLMVPLAGQAKPLTMATAAAPLEIACSVESQCPVGYKCDNGKCAEAVSECTSDSQCIGDHVCVDGKCVEAASKCTDNSQCIVGKKCDNGTCVTVENGCNTDNDCATGMKCKNWVCVKVENECIYDSDCAVGMKCENWKCVTASATCTSPGQIMNGSGKCACSSGWICTSKDTSGNCLCTQSGKTVCTGAGQTMGKGGYCVCLSGWACTKKSYGNCVCSPTDPGTSQTKAQFLQKKRCSSNRQCGAGMKCEDGKCVSTKK